MADKSSILEHICSNVFKAHLPVYFIMDRSGNILECGGNLKEMNIKVPVKDELISDILIFMEGILPLQEKTMEFSCIKMPQCPSMDAFLFKTKNGYGLIVWDATTKDDFLTQTQQKFNELSLLIEKQKSRLMLIPDSEIEQKHENFLYQLFKELNFAVLEMKEEGQFTLIGTPPHWIEQIPQASQILAGEPYEEDVFSFLGNFIKDTKTRWTKHPHGSHKSGIWIEKDPGGQELLFEATAVDVHGRKFLIIAHDIWHPNEKQSLIQKGRDLALNYHALEQSEKKLQNLHDEMEQRIKERTRELEEANLKLATELKERKKVQEERDNVFKQLRQSQKMEAIGTLAGGIAHDFNNILSAIMGFSELSIMEAEEGSELRDRLEKILKASNRAKDMVKQILTFSRQSEYEKRPLKLKSVVEEVLNLLKATIPSFILIEKELDSDSYILADQTQIHQVIMNLCTNAWHAMKEGAGTLKVKLKDIEIKPGDELPSSEISFGNYLILTIEDTGIGISPDNLERIFNPYFTTKRKDKGTGLGLSLVHGIITQSKGAIQVKSELGQGSTFSVYLPAFDVSHQEKPVSETLYMGKNERIFLIDDEPFQTQMGKEHLERIGYNVETCNDSEEALKIFLDNTNRFDLVITDMVMPKMTGKSLVIKMLEIRPDLPVILLSGYSDDIDPHEIEEIGISQYLMKPVGMKELSHAIRNALNLNS